MVGGVGGSGSAGGCGGSGGGKGQGGGASIALAIFEASALLESTSLVTKDAGNGGDGGKGQKGQLGYLNGGAPNGGAEACTGGGGSGGGGGGLSVGILYKGTAPKIDGSEVATADGHALIKVGTKGGPGALSLGGTAADGIARAGKEGLAGLDGSAKAVNERTMTVDADRVDVPADSS